VPCSIGTATAVRDLFVIERGAPRLTDVPYDEAVQRLLGNTEDAYSFPPFRYFAPALMVDGLDHAQLRGREREILAGFLSGVRVRALASDCFGWADEISRLMAQDRVGAAPAEHLDSEERPHWEWQFDTPLAVPSGVHSLRAGGPS